MDKLRAGVIGLGMMGQTHSRAYVENSLSELVAVADLNIELAEKVSKELGVKLYTDYREMLKKEDIDAVSICTPDHLHKEMAVTAAEFGKDMLIEKPIAISSEEGEQIIKAAESAKVKLMIAHCLRFDPGYWQTYEAVRRGDIGKVVHFFARRNDLVSDALRLTGRKRTTVVYYLAVHDIDAIRWILDSEVERVYAESNSVVFKDEGLDDSVLVVLKLKNGCVGAIETTWVLKDSVGKSDMGLDIIGTEGAIYLSFNPSVRLHDKVSTKYVDTTYRTFVDGKMRGAYANQINHFIECVLYNREPLVRGNDGLMAVKVAEAITKSLEEDRPIIL